MMFLVLGKLAGEGKCVIAVTHSASFAEKADVVYRLEKHKLVKALDHPYEPWKCPL